MEMAQKVLALPMGMLREYLNQKILDNPMAELDQPVIRARMEELGGYRVDQPGRVRRHYE